MAIRWVEGFDDYTKTSDLNMTYLNSVFDHCRILLGRANYGQSIHFTHLYESLEFVTPHLGYSDYWVIGFAFKPDISVEAEKFIFLEVRNNNTPQVGIMYDPDSRTLNSVADGNPELIFTNGEGTKPLTLNTWYYVEWKVTLHPTAGTSEIRINEVVDSSGTGNTSVPSSTLGNVFAFRRPKFYHYRYGLDDIYILDGEGTTNIDYLGDVKIETLTTIGPGHYTDWISSTGGSNWEAANSLADGDYVQTNVDKAKDTYTFSPVQQIVDVAAVAVKVYVRNTDLNTHVIEAMMRTEDTDYFGLSQSVPEISFRSFMHIQETDPSTGLPWAVDGVNASEFGIRMINTYLITSGGNLNLGGSAPFIFLHTYPPQEGTIGSLQGSADYEIIFTPVTGGNLDFRGEAKTNPFYGSGNLMLEGTADVVPTYLYDASGSLTKSGSTANYQLIYTFEPVGGFKINSGAIDIRPTYRYTASGRVRTGSSANVNSNAWHYAASGTLRIGSTSVGMSSYYEFTASGRVRTTGSTAPKEPTYIYDLATGTLRFTNGASVVGP